MEIKIWQRKVNARKRLKRLKIEKKEKIENGGLKNENNKKTRSRKWIGRRNNEKTIKK